MFWVGVIACILMLIVFFGVTIAGGRAHDRQNRENAMKARRVEELVQGGLAAKEPGRPGDDAHR